MSWFEKIKQLKLENERTKYEKVQQQKVSKRVVHSDPREENLTQELQITITLPSIPLEKIKEEDAQNIVKSRYGGFVHKDLVFPDAAVLKALTTKQKEILKDYKGAISSEHLAAMRVSFIIMNLEDKNIFDEAAKIYKYLESRYHLAGKHMYNICRSGFIEGKIIVDLHMMKFQSQSGEAYKRRFSKYFDDCMDFFPYGVWSNEYTAKSDIIVEIMKRLRMPSVPIVEVYGRGEYNVRKVYEACNVIHKEEQGVIYRTSRYNIGYSPCICIIMQKIPPKKIQKKKTKKKK